MRVKGKTADYQKVVANSHYGLFGGFLNQFRADRAVLRAYAHRYAAALAILFRIFADRVYPKAGMMFKPSINL